MSTYEEFLKDNKIEDLQWLFFAKKDSPNADVTLNKGNPEEYTDIAKQAINLKEVKVEEAESKEFYEGLTKFIKNCNEQVKISNGVTGSANKSEYLKGEEKINEILDEINPEWSTKQKLAYVHYKMGEIVSYVPDFNFGGMSIAKNSRNVWKSIVDGKSVCNGIVNIERNILSRLGIKTKELSSGTHSFLLTETEEGNIITDPTWDLSNTLYQARPMYFGVTYEELRKREKGLSNAHKLENPPENVIEIPEQELREIYHSIGLTHEDKRFWFPILDEVQNIKKKEYPTLEAKIDDCFNMFTEKFSKEVSHLSETRTLLETVISDMGIQRNQIRTKFVYSKEDKESENPFLICHIDSDNLKEKIRILDTAEMKFKEMDLKEFDENYKTHDLDILEPFWKKYIPENNIQKEQKQEQEQEK